MCCGSFARILPRGLKAFGLSIGPPRFFRCESHFPHRQIPPRQSPIGLQEREQLDRAPKRPPGLLLPEFARQQPTKRAATIALRFLARLSPDCLQWIAATHLPSAVCSSSMGPRRYMATRMAARTQEDHEVCAGQSLAGVANGVDDPPAVAAEDRSPRTARNTRRRRSPASLHCSDGHRRPIWRRVSSQMRIT